MKSWKRWAVVIILAVESFVAYAYIARNSDAYAEAERFLRANSTVNERIGAVRDVSIEPFGASMRLTGAATAVQFDLDLEGSKTPAKAYVQLERRGSWHVREAQLAVPGQPFEKLR